MYTTKSEKIEKSEVDEFDFENPETCPNCGHYAGDESTCPNCGAVLFNENDELNPFEEDEGEPPEF